MRRGIEEEKGEDEIFSSRAFPPSQIRRRWTLKTTPPVEDGAYSVEVTMPWGTVPSESLRAVKTPRKLGTFWRSSERLPLLNKDRSHRRTYLDEHWGNSQGLRLKLARRARTLTRRSEIFGMIPVRSGYLRRIRHHHEVHHLKSSEIEQRIGRNCCWNKGSQILELSPPRCRFDADEELLTFPGQW